jgi:hypothetical protein
MLHRQRAEDSREASDEWHLLECKNTILHMVAAALAPKTSFCNVHWVIAWRYPMDFFETWRGGAEASWWS